MFDADFVSRVDRSFVENCARPILVLMGNDGVHPSGVAREVAASAPNTELVEKWTEPEFVAGPVGRVRAFFLAHAPRQGGAAHPSLDSGERLLVNDVATEDSFRRNSELLGLWLSGDESALADALSGDSERAHGFLDFVDRHGLRFHFTASLEGSNSGSLFEPATLKEWTRFLSESRARQTKLVEELPGLDDLFRGRGIDYRLLKGPFLGQRFFGGVEMRHFGDLDLLIRPDCLGATDAMLIRAGFERRSRLPFGRRFATRFAHGCDYRRGLCRLDLHWAPATHPSYRINEDRLWEEAGTFEIANRRIPVLSEQSALLFVAVSFFEDLDRGAGRLKSVVDLERMLTRMDGTTDWPALFARADGEGFGSIFPSILGLAVDVTGAARRLPSLAAELDKRAARAPVNWDARAALLEAARGRFANKLWAWKLYDYPSVLSFAWWAFSLPLRRAIYAPIRFPGHSGRVD